ncbi:MAG: hypothetical protein H6R33_123 [Actinobacteria bacterium]|nr:hypothetical protein [Actinomycetota bacterium]
MRGKALAVLSLAALLTPLAALPAGSAVTCFGQAPTITAAPGTITRGTNGDDVIIGTDGDDEIRGNSGRDRICGLGGNDRLYGGPGRDRISGGGGDDYIQGNTGLRHTLTGGPGDDYIEADGDWDRAAGNGGADYISTYSGDHTTARGGRGNDIVLAGDSATLDGGAGVDRCDLSNGAIPVDCEALRLLCGVGGIALPDDVASLPGLTSAAGAFDGDPDEDTLYMWRDPALGWVLHVELDNGYGVQQVLGAPAEHLAAIGGHDINGDGIDEVFAQLGSNPRRVVGIGAVYLTVDGMPRNCILEGVQWGSGSDATFAIGTDAGLTNGLACRGGEHTIRQFVQQPWTGGTYLQHRYDYGYAPNFGVDNPVFVPISDAHPVFDPTDPADAAILQRGGEFHCAELALP